MEGIPHVPIGINRIICGDCIEEMQKFPADFFDSIITDPPYGLEFMGKEWDKLLVKDRHVDYPSCRKSHGPNVYLAGTQRQQWHYQWAKEVLRVAKPGTFMLCFGGTRTFHRLTCAIEDAGWQIRDCIMWLYGSGFPKSLDISKAIDKTKGVKREIVNQTKSGGYKRLMITNKEQGFRPDDYYPEGNKFTSNEPITDSSRKWNGWGTALKPAWEPIIVAMKPLDGTFAQNAEKYGVAGLWINGGRINANPRNISNYKSCGQQGCISRGVGFGHAGEQYENRIEKKCRWPANLILDEEAAKMLDEQSGKISYGKKEGGYNYQGKKYQVKGFVKDCQPQAPSNYGDSGGASRFFYCAKSSKRERTCNGKVECSHPTVKPLTLMEYLCKLTKTPNGGIVLDPFGGSGTTALACIKTGRKYVLIEKEQEYCKIARQRINALKG